MIWILKYWVKRARHVRLVRSQIAGLLEKKTNKYCEFCGINWGLRGETIENIEEIFLSFWRELLSTSKARKSKEFNNKCADKNNEINNYETKDIINWQQYFERHATIRTICFECMNEVFEQKKKNTGSNEKTLHVIKEEEALLSEREKKKKHNILLEKGSTIEIIKFWLRIARKEIKRKRKDF